MNLFEIRGRCLLAYLTNLIEIIDIILMCSLNMRLWSEVGYLSLPQRLHTEVHRSITHLDVWAFPKTMVVVCILTATILMQVLVFL